MAPQTKHHEELLAAWRALAGHQESEGWRTIQVVHGGPCRFLAGRHFPGNEEALLVGFDSVRIPPAGNLPEGGGFQVGKAVLPGKEPDRAWIALSRQSAGNLDLFTMMADDVIATLQSIQEANDERLFHLFLTRIRAWQSFMRQSKDCVLSPEAEVGLFGELEFLHDLISAGLPAIVAVESWQGPLDGLQDFSLGAGAIEVKSTVSAGGFSATIGSLEQLDDSLIRPIFLAGIRFELSSSGRTLPDQAVILRNLLADDPRALAMLGNRLLHAGLLPGLEDHYTRRFVHMTTRLLHVTEGFPRLTSADIPNEIRKARYEVDLDLISSDGHDIRHALAQLGMI